MLAVVVITVGAIAMTILREKRRARQMSEIAVRLGFSYTADGRSLALSYLDYVLTRLPFRYLLLLAGLAAVVFGLLLEAIAGGTAGGISGQSHAIPLTAYALGFGCFVAVFVTGGRGWRISAVIAAAVALALLLYAEMLMHGG